MRISLGRREDAGQDGWTRTRRDAGVGEKGDRWMVKYPTRCERKRGCEGSAERDDEEKGRARDSGARAEGRTRGR